MLTSLFFLCSVLAFIISDASPLELPSTSIYHSYEFFALNYEEMLANFKIYVYPLGDHSKYDMRSEPGQNKTEADTIFLNHLVASEFVTDNPEDAHLLFVPISVRRLLKDRSVGKRNIGRFLRGYIQLLREKYPYWNKTLGADHVFISCDRWEGDASRNVLELKKNAVQMICSSLIASGTHEYYPHKDVPIPVYLKESAGASDPEHWLYVSGLSEADTRFGAVQKDWESDEFFRVSSSQADPNMLSTSKFCMSLGDDGTMILKALSYGCIPVIMSSGYHYDLPFQDILDWHSFSVVLSFDDISRLKNVLKVIGKKQYKTMQSLAIKAGKHMKWNSPPVSQDAFYMALYELWSRRHTIRYARRSS